MFTETQVVEESIKSILMQVDLVWKGLIVDSEKTFMDGQIGALFAFSGLTSEYEKQMAVFEKKNPDAVSVGEEAALLNEVDSNSPFYTGFVNYLYKFKMLFDLDGVKKELVNVALFRRALLCFGGKNSYMLPPGTARQSFLDNTYRDYRFKRLLRDDNEGNRGYLKELMDEITIDWPAIGFMVPGTINPSPGHYGLGFCG